MLCDISHYCKTCLCSTLCQFRPFPRTIWKKHPFQAPARHKPLYKLLVGAFNLLENNTFTWNMSPEFDGNTTNTHSITLKSLGGVASLVTSASKGAFRIVSNHQRRLGIKELIVFTVPTFTTVNYKIGPYQL